MIFLAYVLVFLSKSTLTLCAQETGHVADFKLSLEIHCVKMRLMVTLSFQNVAMFGPENDLHPQL